MSDDSSRLRVRRRIEAKVDTVFAAWTDAEQLRQWWGPRDVRCVAAEIDLRVGGRYRIGNEFPDGSIRWIVGAFEVIDPSVKLVFSWRLEDGPPGVERVSVLFDAVDDGHACELTIVHERIPNQAVRDQHELGWSDCLAGLAALLRQSP